MNRNRIKVFFDGGCALCRAEISHYAKLEGVEKRVQWIDISRTPHLLSDIGAAVDAAMRRLHVSDHRGDMQTGAEAFVTLWSELPYYRWLAKAVRATRTTGILEALYRPFAAWRYARRTCGGACTGRTRSDRLL